MSDDYTISQTLLSVTVADQSGTVLVLESPNSPDVTVDLVGIQGPKGNDGIDASHYDFIQNSPSLLWTVNHNKGYKPAVSVFSVGGVEVEAQITHTSLNQTQIGFNIPTAGSATFT
jgi:hypothetical protein